MSQHVLVMVYLSFFHLIMSYGVIFWGASPHNINIFRLKKKKKLRGLSLRANYTDRAAAACRRS